MLINSTTIRLHIIYIYIYTQFYIHAVHGSPSRAPILLFTSNKLIFFENSKNQMEIAYLITSVSQAVRKYDRTLFHRLIFVDDKHGKSITGVATRS